MLGNGKDVEHRQHSFKIFSLKLAMPFIPLLEIDSLEMSFFARVSECLFPILDGIGLKCTYYQENM